MDQITLAVRPAPYTRPPLLMARNAQPLSTPAAFLHSSMKILHQLGTGTVRRFLPFPSRSTSTQRPSRSWISSTESRTHSSRRNPQVSSNAKIARSRLPLRVSGSGSESSRLAWSRVSQFPARGPSLRGLNLAKAEISAKLIAGVAQRSRSRFRQQ